MCLYHGQYFGTSCTLSVVIATLVHCFSTPGIGYCDMLNDLPVVSTGEWYNNTTRDRDTAVW